VSSPPLSDAAHRIVSAEFVAAAADSRQLPPPTSTEVAFAGRSNVGKSSLLNSLLGRKGLVRTSSSPGSTRQIAFFEARAADGLQLRLADLPGYGYAKRSKTERRQWADLIESFLLERPSLATVVVLVDARRGVEADDLDLLKLLRGPARVTRRPLGLIVVATKLDKLPRSQAQAELVALSRAAAIPVLGYSAKTHAGRSELWRAIRKSMGLASAGGNTKGVSD
jgi:GTP-binding protein